MRATVGTIRGAFPAPKGAAHGAVCTTTRATGSTTQPTAAPASTITREKFVWDTPQSGQTRYGYLIGAITTKMEKMTAKRAEYIGDNARVTGKTAAAKGKSGTCTFFE